MADGINDSSIRVLGNVSNVLARREAPTGGSAPETRTTKDVFVRNDGQADVKVLHEVIAELQARIAALEAKVSVLTDDETYAPVPLGQLSKPGSWATLNEAPTDNAPAKVLKVTVVANSLDPTPCAANTTPSTVRARTIGAFFSTRAGGPVAGRPVRWRVTQFPYDWQPPKPLPGFFYSTDSRFSRDP